MIAANESRIKCTVMKVYVLVQGEMHEGYNVIGVYSSRELAQEQENRKELTSTIDYYDIIEFEIDNKRYDLDEDE